MDQPGSQLIESGRTLVGQLRSLASEYHVKSTQHEMLLWEASIIQAEIDNLLNDVQFPQNLRRSILLTPSDVALTQRIPVEASRSVRNTFHIARGT